MDGRPTSRLHPPSWFFVYLVYCPGNMPGGEAATRIQLTLTRAKPADVSAPPARSLREPNRCNQYRNRRALASSTTQAKPSLRFSPVMALHRRMFHVCVRISSNRSPWGWLVCQPWSGMVSRVSIFWPNQPLRARPQSCTQRRPSCLQTPTDSPLKVAFRVRQRPLHAQPRVNQMLTSSCRRPCSSSLQSSMRSLSVASTTQIRASVFSK